MPIPKRVKVTRYTAAELKKTIQDWETKGYIVKQQGAITKHGITTRNMFWAILVKDEVASD